VVDPYQVVEARVAGADAILLMLSVLDDESYRQCAAEAARLTMDVLTEVHTEDEVHRAIALKAGLIGINNRDLQTLAIDTATTSRLRPRIPKETIVVSESGIRSRRDVDALRQQVNAFLVGSQLMKAKRLDLAVRKLIFGDVKICGLTTAEQIQMAYDAGASFGGLIFAPESPRCVSKDRAGQIAIGSPLPLVGVFVNGEIDWIAELAGMLRFCAVQLHGDESATYVSSLRSALPRECQIWKAIPVRESLPALDVPNADRIVLDTHRDAARGGTGQSFDWSLLQSVDDKSRLIVSGGIGPENVCRAHEIGCGGLDVNSGVESAPGIKDEHALRKLFAALRGE
jgi:indole-3-glycerol phosphate synthase/phosphoribosylanthranilate isomerase